jgi:hypothetical protein
MGLGSTASLVLLESYGSAVAGWFAVDNRRTCLLTAIAVSLLAIAVPAVAAQDEIESADPLPRHVLFIGNSHTSRHGGLDWLVGNFAAAEDPPREFDGKALTEGGVTLEYHWQNGARALIRDGEFDTVVLQGYLPGSETRTDEPFLEYARLFDAVIRESGAKTVFFMTWPRGFNDWSDVDDVIEAHRMVEAELGAKVAPAAYAFELARAERPDIELISEDKVHASWEGAYLAAATVYATLFDRSPEGLPYAFGLSDEDAAFLQRIAGQAVTDWREGTVVVPSPAPSLAPSPSPSPTSLAPAASSLG